MIGLRWENTGRPLTLKEQCLHGYGHTGEYERSGIVIEDLSPSEITAAVMEGEQHVVETWMETDEDQDRQRRFWAALRNWPDVHEVHGKIHPEARAGCVWLKSMGDVFLE